MRDKLSSSLLREFAPKNIGEQIHTNHLGCSAGTDTKRRLYIKRVPGGILGYCHHCNTAGFVRSLTPEGADLSKWIKGENIDIPEVLEYEEDMFMSGLLPFTGSQGDEWLNKYLQYVPIDTNYILGSGKSDQVRFKLYTIEHGGHIGFQTRNVVNKPKYITQYRSEIIRGDASWFDARSQEPYTLFITEDYLSAYKIFKVANLSSVALLKTTASDATIRQIQDFAPLVVNIWLDNDSAGVAGSTKLLKRLQFALPSKVEINICTTVLEPKEQSVVDLLRICKGLAYVPF